MMKRSADRPAGAAERSRPDPVERGSTRGRSPRARADPGEPGLDLGEAPGPRFRRYSPAWGSRHL